MDPEQFFTASGVIIVAGKGGVGKTAVTAAMSVAASSVGLRTLVVEVEGKSGLDALFARSQANLKAVADFVAKHDWVDFLAVSPEIRSSTSICLKVTAPWFAALADADDPWLHALLLVRPELRDVLGDEVERAVRRPGLRRARGIMAAYSQPDPTTAG